MLKDYDISLTVRCEENPNKWIVDALYDNLEQRRNEDILLWQVDEVSEEMSDAWDNATEVEIDDKSGVDP